MKVILVIVAGRLLRLDGTQLPPDPRQHQNLTDHREVGVQARVEQEHRVGVDPARDDGREAQRGEADRQEDERPDGGVDLDEAAEVDEARGGQVGQPDAEGAGGRPQGDDVRRRAEVGQAGEGDEADRADREVPQDDPE